MTFVNAQSAVAFPGSLFKRPDSLGNAIAHLRHGECFSSSGGRATAILAVIGVRLHPSEGQVMGREPERSLARSLRAAEAFQETCWRPSADIYQTEEGWLLKFDLAGVKPSDIEVSIRGRSLTVTGVRRDWAVAECRHSYSMEISYNRFSRTIELPADLQESEISTQYRDGMLLVRLKTQRGGT
jgi:HSP20 family protein